MFKIVFNARTAKWNIRLLTFAGLLFQTIQSNVTLSRGSEVVQEKQCRSTPTKQLAPM